MSQEKKFTSNVPAENPLSSNYKVLSASHRELPHFNINDLLGEHPLENLPQTPASTPSPRTVSSRTPSPKQDTQPPARPKSSHAESVLPSKNNLLSK